jgi:hypothetical protein
MAPTNYPNAERNAAAHPFSKRRPSFDGQWGIGRRPSLDGLSRALDNAQGPENKARQEVDGLPWRPHDRGGVAKCRMSVIGDFVNRHRKPASSHFFGVDPQWFMNMQSKYDLHVQAERLADELDAIEPRSAA